NAPETERLLSLVGGGDRAAFDLLFARHRSYLRRVVELRLDQRMQARVDPSDVVQEAQMEAFRRLPDYLARRPMAFRLWLRKTVQERLLMAERFHRGASRRAVGREVPLNDYSSLHWAKHLQASADTPSQLVTTREKARQVRQAVAHLSAIDREILVLRNLEELSNRETAELLGIDPAAASQRYGRALLRLRRVLTDRGILEAGA
ncbi:MAG: sigma-70 family RNA polymerase sigma factor, partial [Candidatus Acidiferrum sp.]